MRARFFFAQYFLITFLTRNNCALIGLLLQIRESVQAVKYKLSTPEVLSIRQICTFSGLFAHFKRVRKSVHIAYTGSPLNLGDRFLDSIVRAGEQQVRRTKPMHVSNAKCLRIHKIQYFDWILCAIKEPILDTEPVHIAYVNYHLIHKHTDLDWIVRVIKEPVRDTQSVHIAYVNYPLIRTSTDVDCIVAQLGNEYDLLDPYSLRTRWMYQFTMFWCGWR